MKLSITNVLSEKISGKYLEVVSQRYKKNMLAFKVQIPSIFSHFEKHLAQDYCILPTSELEINILHKATGLMLYPLTPSKYVEAQLAENNFFESILSVENTATALIVLGVGLGYHLTKLLENQRPNFLVIYEPEDDLFKASLYTSPWFEILTYCQSNNIIIFIQHGKIATNIEEDLKELQDAFPNIGKLIFFRHLAYECIDKQIANIPTLKNQVSTAVNDLHPLLALPKSEPWLKKALNSVTENSALLEKNLVFFEKNFPELHKKLNQQISVKKGGLRSLLLQHLGSEALNLFLHYSTASLERELTTIFQDPLVYGNRPSKNIKDTPFVELVNNIKSEIENININPQSVQFAEIILLGTLDYLACRNTAKNTKKIVVIEQSIGRFLISCFLVPWHEIANEKDVFWLIGETATRDNFEDLYRNSSIHLTDFYLFQPYYTQGHQKLYQQILETIQSLNGKSNYFEKEFRAITRIITNSSRYHYAIDFAHGNLAQPVVIIGNGPSLEHSIGHLRTIKNHIVIISCGTAIMTLYKNGILPDIHLELEKELDTYNRLQLLPAEYLKKITLWASSEIHPKIPMLFGDSKLFSLSASTLEKEMYKTLGFQAISLSYSYYTVTNFALDILLQWGCKKVLLVGVDFGFLSIDEHHSKSSSYFTNIGKSVYDYELVHGATFRVEGNTTDTCLTVPAFNVARELMQQALANNNNKSEVINIGSGAKIHGTKTMLNLNELVLNEANPSDKNWLSKPFAYLTHQAAQVAVKETIENLTLILPKLISIWEKQSSSSANNEINLTRINHQRTIINNVIPISELSYQCLDGSIRYCESIFHRYSKLKSDDAMIERLIEHWLFYLQEILLEIKMFQQRSI